MTPGLSYLVTGGSGSFGHAFVAWLLAAGDARRVAVLSRDEAKQASMRALFPDPRMRFMVGDVRDARRLYRAMQEVDVVVHAAALKRVEVAEVDADECVKTNVLGTANVIEAATDAKVARVLLLSTDKACAPLNAYGASKLLAEKMILAANQKRGAHGPRFAVTRYGNVTGSRGSVIPVWRARLAAGQRIDITNPGMTRYWMPLADAVQLVAWTLATMQGGELVVPDLPAYELGDLAVAMTETGPVDITGARPGEKMHEAMISAFEAPFFGEVLTATAPTRWPAPVPDPAPRRYFVQRVGIPPELPLTGPHTSDRARRLTVPELRALLAEVP